MTPELASLMMDHAGGPGTPNDRLKRKTPPDDHLQGPQPKAAKTNSNTISINYLVRQFAEDLPLISNDDTLPSLLSLLSDYQGVLDRHESMACNLGARPLGPILIKRFERLFDGPPKVLKSHGKEGATVTWLDIVEFARNKPEQFTLGQMSEGVRVCQFYTKQCRVQISEEDFLLISSGIPQKMIPPQPIVEDEEKELGTIEILEKTLSNICQLADSVAARTRQLNHRLKGRKQAILDRRASDNPPAARASSPATQELLNGAHASALTQSPNSGFVAVNKSHADTNGGHSGHAHTSGSSKNAASSATHDELRNKFLTLSERRQQSSTGDVRRPSVSQHPTSATVKRAPSYQDNPEYTQAHTSPVPIPNTPSSLLPHHNPAPARTSVAEKDDGGPYKAEMVARMESLAKNERIMPPCDRCRRLHMDCLKNLTACVGCTRKHAKCSWREVRESEVRGGHSAPSSIASTNMPLGLGADDVDDEPASVGQRTPPHYTHVPTSTLHPQHPHQSSAAHTHQNPQSQHQQQAAAAAAALQHHSHSHHDTHSYQSGLRSPPHHMHTTSNTHSPSRVRSPEEHHRTSQSHIKPHSHHEPQHHDTHPRDTHSQAHPSRSAQHSPNEDVKLQLQEAARQAQVESEAQAQHGHPHFEQPAMGVSGYQNPNVGAGHVKPGIEA